MVAPMGVMKRVTMVFRAKANRALDRMEDPRETLDYSYQTQLELLQKVRRGVADVATSRKRVELQINQLQQQSTKLDRQARDSLGAGREDLAREALTRKAGLQTQLDDLQGNYEQLQKEEEQLGQAASRLQTRVDAFRTRKETIKATYTAAEAQTRINEAFAGISEEMGDVGLAIQRAEDKTAQMRARAGALDELMASGALEDMVGGPHDDIQAELDRMGAGQGVDHELERMKLEIAQSAPRQLEGAQPGSSDGASSASDGASSASDATVVDPAEAGEPE
jgi:phage shock protein A